MYFSTPPSFFFTKLTMQSQKKMNFPMPLHCKHCKEEATIVTQFWIHQDFSECYFISIIIYKNPKKIKKSLKLKKIFFLESTASFHQNRVHRVDTGLTMSTGMKNEFQVILGQICYFRSKPGPPSRYLLKVFLCFDIIFGN